MLENRLEGTCGGCVLVDGMRVCGIANMWKHVKWDLTLLDVLISRIWPILATNL